jgi:hypothetical protein
MVTFQTRQASLTPVMLEVVLALLRSLRSKGLVQEMALPKPLDTRISNSVIHRRLFPGEPSFIPFAADSRVFNWIRPRPT